MPALKGIIPTMPLTPFPPVTLVTTNEESKALDKLAIQGYGMPGILLMENAARSIFREALAFFPGLRDGPKKISILCGPGQNGGDGWAIARLFHNMGHEVACFLAAGPGAKPKGSALTNMDIAGALGIPITGIPEGASKLPVLKGCYLLVDALFGTGLSKPLTGAALRLVRHANASRGDFRTLAVDLPSGLSGDTGEALGPVIPADLTVSLGTLKRGFFQNEGPRLCGTLALGDIGLSPGMYASLSPKGTLCDAREARKLLPARPKDGHKGSFGHAVVCGGSLGKSGALVLAALGAIRAGAGLVTAAHPACLSDVVQTKLTSAMTLPLSCGGPDTHPPSAKAGPKARHDGQGELQAAAADELLAFIPGKAALALGPGLGLSDATKAFTLKVAAKAGLPLVLDADALTHLAGSLEAIHKRKRPTILTPHPGEAARLLGCGIPDIQADRIGMAKGLSMKTGAVVILKGSFSVVADPSGDFSINPTGGSILAAGGSGDLLTGLLCGILATGAKPFDAARLAAWAHGRAADLAAAALGPYGVSPAEIQPFLTKVWAELEGAVAAPLAL
ncbi:MAG: NAD(P)H-hydrate dehydratase [Deltaproteobacteria bacterium]|jgi:NAD(P)H-hydrate epimerase|nr:NAD(P)H-hydrate dehydratase [Deltaproteobacteria bacterium]